MREADSLRLSANKYRFPPARRRGAFVLRLAALMIGLALFLIADLAVVSLSMSPAAARTPTRQMRRTWTKGRARARTPRKVPARRASNVRSQPPLPVVSTGQAGDRIKVEKNAIASQVYSLADQALNLQLAGDYGLAARQLMEATQLSESYFGRPSPAQALLYLDLARAAEQAGQLELAKHAYAQGLERKTDSGEAHLRLAGLLARLGQIGEATAEARKAVSLDPADARAHLMLALLLERQGRLAEARAERESSWALLKAYPQARPPEVQLQSPDFQAGDLDRTGPEAPDKMPFGLP